MGSTARAAPVRSYVDPRIEIYAPNGSRPYYRLVYYDMDGYRLGDTTGGKTLRSARQKAARLSKQIRRFGRTPDRDPARVLAHDEAQRWLDPMNHRTRGNRPWTQRHADNAAREWRLRIAPNIPRRASVAQLTSRQLWIRILNDAAASGLAPATVQKTGAICRSFITWLMDQELLANDPMRGVRYTMSRADNRGLDPRAVHHDEIPNFDMVYDLALWMSWLAWPKRPARGGDRRPDAVGPEGRGLQPVLVATTGLRNGELFALRPSRIDLANLEIEIVEQLVEEESGKKYFEPPKQGSIRVVNFAGFLEHDLKELLDHRRAVSGEDDPILFCAPRGGLEWRRNHSRRFRTAATKAGWSDHMTWYSLRHLYGVSQLERLPLEVVSRLMGHHSADFTAKRYLSSPRVGWQYQARDAARAMDLFE